MAKFLFFSQAKDITLLDECEINIPANTNVYQLWQILIDNYPELKKCRSTCRLAINLQYATEETTANNNDEIAVIPPVAGG